MSAMNEWILSMRIIISQTSFFSNYVAPEAVRFAQREQQRVDKAAKAEKEGKINKADNPEDAPSKGLTDAFRKSILLSRHLEQRGVMRSNCIDCLDRTNVAQVGNRE